MGFYGYEQKTVKELFITSFLISCVFYHSYLPNSNSLKEEIKRHCQWKKIGHSSL